MKTSTWLKASLITTTLTLTACSSGITDDDLDTISVDTVRAYLSDSGESTILIDARTRAAYEDEHLPGAIHKPLQDIRRFDPDLKDADRIIVYGDGWKDDRVPAVVKRLLAYEYTEVYDFRGGLLRWHETLSSPQAETASD